MASVPLPLLRGSFLGFTGVGPNATGGSGTVGVGVALPGVNRQSWDRGWAVPSDLPALQGPKEDGPGAGREVVGSFNCVRPPGLSFCSGVSVLILIRFGSTSPAAAEKGKSARTDPGGRGKSARTGPTARVERRGRSPAPMPP